MKIPFVDLHWQEAQIHVDRERRFRDVIERTAFVLGPEVEEFEQKFALYCGTQDAIAVANGTDALMLIYKALGIGEGDEVITIPTTFIASVSPFAHLGAKPVFVDIDKETRNFNLKELEKAITPRTKAILAVHLYGTMSDMDAVAAIAKRHEVALIEDACQAHGAEYKRKKAGSLGIAAAFSFYPGKNLGAYGDGGAITTSDAELAARIRMLRNHGGVEKYEHTLLGFNSRLDTLQAVVLDEKLKRLPEWNIERRRIANRYIQELEGLPLKLPVVYPDTEPVWHLFVIKVGQDERDSFRAALEKEEIATGLHYPTPLHLSKAFSYLGYKAGDFPESEELAAGCVSLPMYPGMTDAQITHVISAIRAYFHGKK
jgi:dTDP-4-amino-4,6-dideoxygalactose transaminase